MYFDVQPKMVLSKSGLYQPSAANQIQILMYVYVKTHVSAKIGTLNIWLAAKNYTIQIWDVQ